jgi:hypothetical protein
VFRSIDRVRQYRNDVVHQKSTFVCESSHAREAIELAIAFVPAPRAIRPTVNFDFPIHQQLA